jgi:MmyB-like transcription regulator ligand binding domain
MPKTRGGGWSGRPRRLRHGETELAFISTKTTFGTAVDVTVAELSIESLFPADPQTAQAMHDLVGAEPDRGEGEPEIRS